MSETNVLLPMYLYPDLSAPNSQWQQLAQLAIAYPKTEIWAVVNCYNGPGAEADPNYTTALSSIRNLPNIYLLGYVNSDRARSTTVWMQNQMALWKSFYGLDSFFFDNVENTKSQAYYWQLCQQVRSGGGFTFGNPGTSIPESYIGIFDTAVIYEGDLSAENPSVVTLGYDPKNFAAIVYGRKAPPTGRDLLTGYGFQYFTSGTQPNPYSGIPYLQQLLAALLEKE